MNHCRPHPSSHDPRELQHQVHLPTHTGVNYAISSPSSSGASGHPHHIPAIYPHPSHVVVQDSYHSHAPHAQQHQSQQQQQLFRDAGSSHSHTHDPLRRRGSAAERLPYPHGPPFDQQTLARPTYPQPPAPYDSATAPHFVPHASHVPPHSRPYPDSAPTGFDSGHRAQSAYIHQHPLSDHSSPYPPSQHPDYRPTPVSVPPPYQQPHYSSHTLQPIQTSQLPSPSTARHDGAPSSPSASSSPTHPQQQGDRYLCEKCGRSFTRAHDRKRHYETHHLTNPTIHRCRNCDKAFSRSDSLRRHINNNGCPETS